MQVQARRPTKSVKVDTYLGQVKAMSDGELVKELRRHGEDPGPITSTTRVVYERQLARHMAEKTKGDLPFVRVPYLETAVIDVHTHSFRVITCPRTRGGGGGHGGVV